MIASINTTMEVTETMTSINPSTFLSTNTPRMEIGITEKNTASNEYFHFIKALFFAFVIVFFEKHILQSTLI